jgi:transcriptional regulator with XRE-family HTH domain
MTQVNREIGNIIRELRGSAGMSQEDLAARMGVVRPVVTQIEAGARKVSAEEIVKLKAVFDVSAEVLLGVEKLPEVVLPAQTPVKPQKAVERISVPQKNLTKFKEVLLYILNKVGARPSVGETVIYKLLYFIDFNYYEKYEEQLVGATYLKNTYGPTPMEFRKIVDRMTADGEIEPVTSKYFKFRQKKYLPRRKADLSGLSGRELEVINDVLRRLGDMTAKEISAYSHEDVPWKTAADGKPINYEAVFYRTPAYSVRNECDELPTCSAAS